MTPAKRARETIELLWHNYQTVAEDVDLEAMNPENVAKYVARKSPVRPFRIAAWLGRQAFFVAAWSLWEYYTRELCDRLLMKTKRANDDSHVDWVRKSMTVNDLVFTNYEWFGSANCLRILFAHYGGRAAEPRARNLLECSRKAFPSIETYTDDYVAIDHCHVADLELKIEEFIEDTAQHAGAQDGESAGDPPPPVT